MDWKAIDGVGRVALNAFSPGELEIATGLTADMQRVWRRRGHLPARDGGRAAFDAKEVASIAVRHELARFGIAPSETLTIGEEAAPMVLYSALTSSPGTAELRGGFDRIAVVAAQFAQDDGIAARITGSTSGRRYLWSESPPKLHFKDDFAALVSEERHSGMVMVDLAVIGINLAENATKPLFLIDVTGL